MSEMMRVKPVRGYQVRDPKNGQLVEGETEVPRESFWLRRLNEGSIVEASAAPDAAKKAPAAKKTAKK